MKETIKSIIEWHEQTFPDATLEGQTDKYNNEYNEYYMAKTKESILEELADMFIVTIGILRLDFREGLFFMNDALRTFYDSTYTWGQLEETINKKMQINRKRKWNKIGNKFQHIEEGVESVVKE